MSHTHFKKSAGFTLIELMIVVAIIGIISAIAVPSYQRYVIKSKRSDAMVGIEQEVALQEKYYAVKHGYVSFADPFGGVATVSSPESHYNISVNAPTTNTYTITATPLFTDSECTTLTITNTGRKGSTGSFNDSGDGDKCWR